MAAAPVRRSELGEALRACRTAFIGVGVMSCAINLLYLTGSVFMLEVYDRVLPSRSVPTLVGLVILAAGLYIAQGVLDLIRGRILAVSAPRSTRPSTRACYETVVRLPLMRRQPQRRPAAAARSRQRPLVPRQHGTGRAVRSAVAAVLSGDLLCLPSRCIGVTALVGAIILVTLTLITEFLSREPAKEAHVAGGAAQRSRRHQPPQRRGAASRWAWPAG